MANFVYIFTTFSLDPITLVKITIPTLSFAYLQASAGAVAGYGVSRLWVEKKREHLIPYFMGAVAIHGGFIGFSIAAEMFPTDDVIISIPLCL